MSTTGFPPSEDGRAPGVAPITIEDELRRSYLDYAMSVIVSRALPDVRDGLKPVHRRILFSMNDLGMSPDRPYSKSARVVGDVLARLHPHGDQSVYDALVRMAQPFSMGLLLVDGQGNFGSVDGDPPAQMRYTECRMTKAATALLADLDLDTVDFKDNYDGKEKEPVVLPSRIPNLLVNGAGGIAVGMATNIPPHNLGEIIDAALALIARPDLPLDELLDIVPGPDFPTGGEIMGRSAARGALMTGRGSVVMRGTAAIEQIRKDREGIVITAIPYQVNKAVLVERIAELVRKALRGELWLKEAVARAYKPQQRIKAFTVEPRVIIDNQSSNRFTVIEINGLDRIGLLYDLTEALYKLNLNIASAHVTTFGEKAVDVFYVTDLTGAKIENATRHKQIENALGNILKPAQAPMRT